MATGAAQAIAQILAITITVLGLSYLLQTAKWVKLYEDFVRQPRQFLPTGFLLFVTGLYVAISFNDWSSTWPIFITALGWLMAIEASILLFKPSLVGWVIQRAGDRQSTYLRLGGVLLVGLGGLLCWEYLLQGLVG